MADTRRVFALSVLAATVFLLLIGLFSIAVSVAYHESVTFRAALDGFAEAVAVVLNVTAFPVVLSRMFSVQNVAPPLVPGRTIDLVFTAHVALFAAAFLVKAPIRALSDIYFEYYARPRAHVLGPAGRYPLSVSGLKAFFFCVALGLLLAAGFSTYGSDTVSRWPNMPVHQSLYYFLGMDLVLALAYVFVANGIAAHMAEKRLGTGT